MKTYPYAVTLAAEYCGATIWGAQTLAHAEKLVDDLRARGCVVLSVDVRK